MSDTKDNLKQLIEGSDVSQEVKDKAFALIDDAEKSVDEIKQEIILLISDEISSELDELGADTLDENDPEVKKAKEEFENETATIEADLEEDMKTADEALDAMADHAEEEQKEALKKSL